MSTIIEGESLLNDGMAIVLYKIFFSLAFSSMTGKKSKKFVFNYFFSVYAILTNYSNNITNTTYTTTIPALLTKMTE